MRGTIFLLHRRARRRLAAVMKPVGGSGDGAWASRLDGMGALTGYSTYHALKKADKDTTKGGLSVRDPFCNA